MTHWTKPDDDNMGFIPGTHMKKRTDCLMLLIDFCTHSVIKKTNIGDDVGKEEPLFTADKSENWCSHTGNQCRSFSQTKYNHYKTPS